MAATGNLARAKTECTNNIVSVFHREVQPLLNELRAKCIAILTSKPTPRLDEVNNDLSRAQEVFDTSLAALHSRLQLVQENIVKLINDVESNERELAPLRYALSDLMDIANYKRDSIMAQAHAREILAATADPSPLGSWAYTYDADGNKMLGTMNADPRLAPAGGVAGGYAQYAPPPQQQQAPPGYGYPPQQYPNPAPYYPPPPQQQQQPPYGGGYYGGGGY